MRTRPRRPYARSAPGARALVAAALAGTLAATVLALPAAGTGTTASTGAGTGTDAGRVPGVTASVTGPERLREAPRPTRVVRAGPRRSAYEEYVALGDSYSAGPLIQGLRLDALGCIRSTNNYPAFLAMYLGVRTLVDVTCSGAQTGDFTGRQETIVPGPPPPPQLAALSPTTDLVTVGIGGNDYGLFGQMISTCARVAPRNPQGAPCRREFTVDGVDTKKRDARRIEGDVTRVLRRVARRAPAADVVVVGYPRILPERGTCAEVPFARGDYRWGDEVERVLNRSLRRATRATGARYVDLYPASRGKDACAGDEAWINGAKLKPFRAANFHPFLRGMEGAARATYRQVTGERVPAAPGLALPPGVPPGPVSFLDPALLTLVLASLEDLALGGGIPVS